MNQEIVNEMIARGDAMMERGPERKHAERRDMLPECAVVALAILVITLFIVI